MEQPFDVPREWISALASLPPPPLREDRDPSKTVCVCGKYISVAHCKISYSGYLNYVVNLCGDCEREWKGYCRIICPKCRKIGLLLKPSRDPHGFLLVSGKCYHLEYCPDCRTGTTKAPIIEKLLFYKERRLPYDVPRSLTL